jgi:hypothetical protein
MQANTANFVATKTLVKIHDRYRNPFPPDPTEHRAFRQWRAWWQRCREHQHQQSGGQRPSWIHRVYKLRSVLAPTKSHVINVPDKSVDLDGVDVIELLQSLLDLSLVGLDIDDEYQGVVLLDFLHGTLGVERVLDDLVLIEARLVGDGLSWVLWLARKLEGLGAVEGG